MNRTLLSRNQDHPWGNPWWQPRSRWPVASCLSGGSFFDGRIQLVAFRDNHRDHDIRYSGGPESQAKSECYQMEAMEMAIESCQGPDVGSWGKW
jgi:hypothetical protein